MDFLKSVGTLRGIDRDKVAEDGGGRVGGGCTGRLSSRLLRTIWRGCSEVTQPN